MNSMTHDMTWDVIEDQQGQDIQAISDKEVEEVSGGNPLAIGIAVAVVAAAAGYALGRWG